MPIVFAFFPSSTSSFFRSRRKFYPLLLFLSAFSLISLRLFLSSVALLFLFVRFFFHSFPLSLSLFSSSSLPLWCWFLTISIDLLSSPLIFLRRSMILQLRTSEFLSVARYKILYVPEQWLVNDRNELKIFIILFGSIYGLFFFPYSFCWCCYHLSNLCVFLYSKIHTITASMGSFLFVWTQMVETSSLHQ